MTTKTQWTDEKIEAALRASGEQVKPAKVGTKAAVDEATRREREKARFQRVLCVAGLVMFALFVAVMLAGCGGDGSTGGGLEGLRPAGQPTAVPTTSHVKTEPTQAAQIVEKTVVVEVTVPVEKIVEIVVTSTPEPEINGFDMSRPEIDESVQPCPIKFWRNGRCTATQAQIEAESEVSR